MTKVTARPRSSRLRRRCFLQLSVPISCLGIIWLGNLYTPASRQFSSIAAAWLSAASGSGGNNGPNASSAAGEGTGKSRRRFVSYTSSPWEKIWLGNVSVWSSDKEKAICREIKSDNQREFLSTYLRRMCTATVDGNPWCLVDDAFKPYWYNVDNMKVLQVRPKGAAARSEYVNQPIVPTEEEEHVFSKFVFRDEYIGKEYVEYIEPLVSHLRHPLAGCEEGITGNRRILVYTRSWILPPTPPRPASWQGAANDTTGGIRNFYFDAGASSWTGGAGGPSLSVIHKLWERYGFRFHHTEAWEGGTSVEAFYKNLPSELADRVHFHQAWITSDPFDPDASKPFIPRIIRERARKDDYVFFKLDIDNKAIETGSVDHLLNDTNDDLDYIDELAWEHHVRNNYIMAVKGWCPKACDYSKSLLDSYMYFLRMRQRGIRAHSWV